MKIEIPVGIKLRKSFIVKQSDTASSLGSGLLDVLSTPAMIAWMEKTAMDTVTVLLPDGYGTVGTQVNIEHLKASPVGKEINCYAEVLSVDKSKLTFKVEAKLDSEIIGTGTHVRFIINNEKFLSKLN